MANPVTTVERYIGGGKLYFTPYVNSVYGTEVEIGEVKDFSLTISSTTKEALSKDTGLDIMVEDVTTGTTTSVKFTTQNVNKENLAMALMASITSEVFAISDTLPDGTTATVSTTIDKLVGGGATTIKGKLRLVAAPLNDSGKKPVLIVHVATIRPTGDVGYIVDDFIKLGFEGKALKTSNGYFDEYLMAVA